MDTEAKLAYYTERFRRLRVNRSGGAVSPHKPCMLLAVIDLVEEGSMAPGRVRFTPALFERFHAYFDVVRRSNDHAKEFYPFFHLRSEGYWHLVPRDGRAAVVEALISARKPADVTENISHVELAQGLAVLLGDAHARAALRTALIQHWFGDKAEQVWAVVGEKVGAVAEAAPARPVRDPAFRRRVLEAYDYRCAASGWRVVTPDGYSLVDAAHLIPWAESQNDNASNGMALTPTFHRALDRHLIAPGPDLKWRVSPLFEDPRVADHQQLWALNGTDVLLPPGVRPDPEALAWRVDALVGR